MPAERFANTHRCRGNQGGAALLIMLVILIIGIAAVLIGSLTLSSIKSARNETTAAALAQAKAALLGRAVSDNTMPGSFPCPDLVTNIVGTNVPDDGIADLLSGNDCPSYIGRLPWKTLGLPDLRDGNGEELWYALSPAFRDDNSAKPINSNTHGTLLVYNANGTTLQTQAGYSAVAVIFSPGSPLASQTRSTTAQKNDPANYLDSANGQTNASPVGTSNPGPFIAGTESATFNDQLLLITTHDLMPLVEQRVAAEVKNALTAYFFANGYYPWADSIGPTADYNADEYVNRGWLPVNASTAHTPNWPTVPPSFPQWFIDNQWYTLIYYSVAKFVTDAPSSCSTCVNSALNMGGTGGVRALFFMPGTYNGTRSIDTLSQYLADSQNYDNSNDNYVNPTSTAIDRNRLYWLSSTSVWNK